MKFNGNRVLISAPSSGSGKTTAVLGILQALKDKNVLVSSFKCGPDYIDPMFHTKVFSKDCINLDTFLMGEEHVKYSLAKNSIDSEISIIEGVMGYYDGISGGKELHSTHYIAKITNTPTILVVNGKGTAYTLVATIKGICDFKEQSSILGIIINNVSKMTYLYLKQLIEAEIPVKCVGFIEKMDDISFESRHLGLVTADEISDISQKIKNLGDRISHTIDLDEIIKISEKSQEFEYSKPEISKEFDVKIAVAKDTAFCFYYKENLDILEYFGAKLVYFSPIYDKKLPDDIDGLYLGGGYPELHLEKLANNKSMLFDIKNSLENGLACIAECGGFMYLGESTEDNNGKFWDNVSYFKGKSIKKEKLVRFGYSTLYKNSEKVINSHEFHYWDSDFNGNFYSAQKGTRNWQCMNLKNRTLAGYPHVHFYGNLHYAKDFLKRCTEYKFEK